jgi:hypothetical protein
MPLLDCAIRYNSTVIVQGYDQSQTSRHKFGTRLDEHHPKLKDCILFGRHAPDAESDH